MPALLFFLRASIRLTPAVLLLASLCRQPANAQWPINPAVNLTIASANDAQQEPVALSDGSGGAIIAWVDFRTGQGKDIYAQRVNASGQVQWAANGIVVCGENGPQDAVVMLPDGLGGAILAWEDARSDTGGYDVYAQRINSAGSAMWTPGGVAVCTASGNQQYPGIISDGKGGVIVSWIDGRPSGTSNIYAQRVSSTGLTQWTTNGVPVKGASVSSMFVPPPMVGDGRQGALLSWDDSRSLSTGPDIYMQRVDSAGVSRWDTNGVPISTADANQHGSVLASDSAGGAFVCWTDYHTAPNTGVYAQHVNASGAVQWTVDGVVVNDTTDNQQDPVIVSDSAGTAIIAWSDKRKGTDVDIYAQRIGSSGKVLWGSAGVPLCTAAGDQYDLHLTRDSQGGALAVWTDARVADQNIFAQRIDGSGNVRWLPNGIAISNAPGSQQGPSIAAEPGGGAIVAWTDGRSLSDDVYAQNVDGTGALGLSPVLLLPSNGAGVNADTARLVWSRVAPVSKRYWLDLATDSLFTFRSSDSTLIDTAKTARGLTGNQTYWWRVRGFDSLWGPYSSVRKFATVTTGVQEKQGLPTQFSLSQNYPNPFNPSTTIRYALPRNAAVRLTVYDALGREVALLVNGRQEAGGHEVVFQASTLASGMYFYRLQAEGFVQIRSLVLLR